MTGPLRGSSAHPPPRHRAGQSVRPAAAAGLYDAHGTALLAMSNLLLDDPHEAEAIVVQVLREAVARRRDSGAGSARRSLAREVYGRASRSRQGRSSDPSSGGSHAPPGPVGHTELSDQQRGVLALTVFGGHSRTDCADLLALPTDVVDGLLRSGLHRLRGTR